MKIILTDKFNTKRTSYILPDLILILLTVHAFHKHLTFWSRVINSFFNT